MDAIILSASHIQYQAIEYYSIHTLSYYVVRIKLNTTNQEHTRLTLDGPRYKNALTRTQAGLPYCCLCNLIHAIATIATTNGDGDDSYSCDGDGDSPSQLKYWR